MKIAIFDHQLNYGGGLRFITNLIISIKKKRPDYDLTFFCDKKKLINNNAFDIFLNHKIKIEQLKVFESTNERKSLFFSGVRYFKRNFLGIKEKPVDIYNALDLEIIACCKNFDLAYFPWPYFLKPPLIDCPKIATFHDFNFKYFFGTSIFSDSQIDFLNTSIKEWMKDTIPVVSSYFMKDELSKFYPETGKIEVIHLSSLNVYNNMPVNNQIEFPFPFLLDLPYITCPVHLTVHKNIGNLIAAASIVNEKEIKFRLVFTGQSTETIVGKSGFYGLVKGFNDDIDVYGLGYISDWNMNLLLRRSFAVLNGSLYEAGNGVGLDAWSLGIPVIQSNIPAFEEHLTLQGFKAFTFNPREVYSIARAIETCLNNNKQREENIQKSTAAFSNISWDNTADAYINIFEESLNKKSHGN
ncbi:MAG: glycosyltransferase [Bacteroidetes bacterium]|nr:glycosyltransferase [Bacteroidota bacterium]